MEWSFPENFFELKLSSLNPFIDPKKPIWEILKTLSSLISNFSLGSINSEVASSAVLINPKQIFIGNDCKIAPFAVIEGPCVIQHGVEIGPHAYVRQGSYIDFNAKVGHCSEIKASILLPHSKAPHFNYVGDSILGSFVNLGAGVVLANYKLNKTPVNVKYDQMVIETDLLKCGAIIGDHSFLGCNTVASPGTVLRKHFQCMPCSNIFGSHL